MMVDDVVIRRVRMEMKEPFETSYGVETEKEFLLVSLSAGGVVGRGECGASEHPFYSEETNGTALETISRYCVPALFAGELEGPSEFTERVRPVRRNEMAKASVESALWDLFSRVEGVPLHERLGGTRTEIPVGISVGIQPTIDLLLEKVDGYLSQGYKRIKVKIKPGYEIEPVRALRGVFGDFPLMVDANSAYSLDDTSILRQLDEYDLMMIEQPLAYDDLYQHSLLAKSVGTPLCLDESIRSVADAQAAHQLGACSIINLKMPRIGGIGETIAMERFCRENGIALWCGGLLESGVGRLMNVAITTLPGFTLPGDTAPSSRYFERDIIEVPVEFSSPGVLTVPSTAGSGARVDEELLESFTVSTTRFTRNDAVL